MKKSKKIQALKKQLIFQVSNNPSNIDKKTPIQNLNQNSEIQHQIEKHNLNYIVEKHPYVLQDLKKVLITVLIALAILLTIYFLKNTQIMDNFSNFIYRLLHLS